MESIKAQLSGHIKKKSTLIFDGWKATESATKALGYRHPPPVVHQKYFRDPSTGYHTNDAESEIHRVKSWCRKKYGYVRGNSKHGDDEAGADGILCSHMDEYMYFNNVGQDIDSVMAAFRFVAGGTEKCVDI